SITKTKYSQSFLANITKIGAGFAGFGPVGLIIGNIFGESAGISTLGWPILKHEVHLFSKINLRKIAWCFKRYIKFPLFSTPSHFFTNLSIKLPVLLMAGIYDLKIVGLYGFAHTIVSLPMNLIGQSISKVFYSEAASCKNNPLRIKKLSIKLIKRLLLVGLIPLIVLIVFGPLSFSFAFGDKWYDAGRYAQILALLLYSRLIFTPVSRIFTVYERQLDGLLINIAKIVFIMAIFYFVETFGLTSFMAVALYSIAMILVYIVTFLRAQQILNIEIEKQKEHRAVKITEEDFSKV
ncbi:MAG: oligosaccharide flippase family protein, partial [bacterium]